MKRASLVAIVAFLLISLSPVCPADPAVDPNTVLPALPPIKAPEMTESEAKALAPAASAPVSELDQYKKKFREAVGSRWYSKINNQNILLNVGTIKVQYTIHWDGVVTAKVVKGAKPSTMFLQTTSLEAIEQTSPYLPFSAELRKQVGDNLTDTLTFTINSKNIGTIQ